jgi:hypothetical protein
VIIVYNVVVNRTLTPHQILDSTGRIQLVEPDVVEAMPRGRGDWTNVHFFKPNSLAYDDGTMSDDTLAEEYKNLALRPVDMYSLLGVERMNPSLVTTNPYATHWKDANGYWCHGAVVNYNGEPRVHVNRSHRGWKSHWTFAGLRK